MNLLLLNLEEHFLHICFFLNTWINDVYRQQDSCLKLITERGFLFSVFFIFKEGRHEERNEARRAGRKEGGRFLRHLVPAETQNAEYELI